jgi:DNA-binding transcriptional LysR family regulator
LLLFDHCKLFRDIAVHRSVSRGAEMNGISQSAASQHIHDLERRLKTILIDRRTRPWNLTAAGRSYLELCREVLRREEEFLAGLDELARRVQGEVRVASIYSVGLSEMSRIQEEFGRLYPECNLHVSYLRPNKIYEALLSDQADLGLVSYPESTRELAVIPWRQEEMCVAVAPGHPLAGRERVTPADLDGCDFAGFDTDLQIRHEVDRFLREAGAEVHMAMEFDNIQMVKEAVALGACVSILPARTMQAEIAQGRLVSIPLREPELRRPVGIVHRRRKQFNRAMTRFVELLRQIPEREPAFA